MWDTFGITGLIKTMSLKDVTVKIIKAILKDLCEHVVIVAAFVFILFVTMCLWYISALLHVPNVDIRYRGKIIASRGEQPADMVFRRVDIIGESASLTRTHDVNGRNVEVIPFETPQKVDRIILIDYQQHEWICNINAIISVVYIFWNTSVYLQLEGMVAQITFTDTDDVIINYIEGQVIKLGDSGVTIASDVKVKGAATAIPVE